MIRFSNIRKEEGRGLEPVTLDDAKAWLLVDYADDDALITAIITKARNWVENYCHISIIEKDITLTISCDRPDYQDVTRRLGISRWDLAFYGYTMNGNWITLPYGPVQEVDTVQVNGSDADYESDGDQIKLGDFADRVQLEYSTGYDRGRVPEGLKTAILMQCAFYFEQRGNTINRYTGQDVGSSEGARNACAAFINYDNAI